MATGYTQEHKDDPVVIILLGAPGSGKGTQAKQICNTLHIPHISTGDILRENIRNNTPLGKEAKGYMDAGKLVPDNLVLDMLFERVSQPDCKRGYLLDGVPRTVAQAEAFDQHLNANTQLVVVNLKVPDSELIRRLSGRRVCPKCNKIYHIDTSPPQVAGICDTCKTPLEQRKDDTQQVIEERLRVYYKQTAPVAEYYKQKGLLYEVDGTQDSRVIFDSIMNYMQKTDRVP